MRKVGVLVRRRVVATARMELVVSGKRWLQVEIGCTSERDVVTADHASTSKGERWLQVERGCANEKDVVTADHAGTSKEKSGNTIYIYYF